MTTEILYCARCRRVIRPREVSEGHYHFADGEAICAECFTRLSRRLRPISGIYEPPKPVDISDIVIGEGNAPGGGQPAKAAAPVPVPAPATAPAPQRTARPSQAVRASGPGLLIKLLVLLVFVLAGLAAGSGIYLFTKGRDVLENSQAGPRAGR